MATTSQVKAQCPNPISGMAATPTLFGGNCKMMIQHAIPDSRVAIFNAQNQLLALGSADANGFIYLSYNCNLGPVTAIISQTISGATCATASISAPIGLPVKLTSFTGEVATAGALLKWTSAMEVDNQKYVIEKSDDGRIYKPVGEIPGSLLSGEDKHYTFTDVTFKSGDVAFYRLNQVDIDGKENLSKIVYINDSKKNSTVRISPNPFVSEIQLIGISASSLNKNNVRLQNVSGAFVNFEFSGSNGIRVDANLPRGMYVLTVDGVAHKLMKN